MRVATYNVHGCVGSDRRPSESRIANVIAEVSADLVGLQELDVGRARSESVNQPEIIAERLGWHCLFQPAIRLGDDLFGNAIISRFPLRLIQTVALAGSAPWYCSESRIAIWAEAITDTGPVQIINTHLGLGRSERLIQAQQLAASVNGLAPGAAAMVLGDLNCLARSRPHRILASALGDRRAAAQLRRQLPTFPTSFPLLSVDHIFVNRALRMERLHVHRTPAARLASDHFPLVADIARGHRAESILPERVQIS